MLVIPEVVVRRINVILQCVEGYPGIQDGKKGFGKGILT